MMPPQKAPSASTTSKVVPVPDIDHDQWRRIDRGRRERVEKAVGTSLPRIVDSYLQPKMNAGRADPHRFDAEMIDA